MADLLEKTQSKLVMMKLIRKYDMLNPLEEYKGCPPLTVWSAKKLGHVKSNSQPEFSIVSLSRRPESIDVKAKELQMMNYINTKRPKTSSRLRSYASVPRMLLVKDRFAKSSRIHSRQSSCSDLNLVLASSLSAKKLPIARSVPFTARRPERSNTDKTAVIKLTSRKSVKVPEKPARLPSTFTIHTPLIRSPKKKRTILSKEVQINIPPTQEEEGLRYEFDQ
eukprot:CAMPEP_0204918074 /NCGR_PEP_ID=MMETSP1397-20131031/15812_1 /ASSEMBLY_ACC=CAM_ASM_000891 /TAXON_ID=49980 /ORGANISM="Climacostomum Climacostomum virens, Strain Stock W-24" /LENGTH=221 /DNA_ID=CAMNT_0052091175 /DNA_START=988 /DNA_END=1650 /DNA_ORIENTATION=-